VFLAVVANRGSTLPVIFFLATAAMWLVLVARADSDTLRVWGTTVPVAHTPVPQSLQNQEVYQHASAARMLGAVALVAAMAVPVVLPRAAPTFLMSGLGRSSSRSSNSSVGVGFSQSLDLSQDLKNRSRAPVLQYSTADTSPPPLQVAIGSTYRPTPGVWLPWGRPWRSSSGTPALSANPRVAEPAGLSPEVPRKAFVVHVHHNLLEDPFLAAPYPLIGADLGGIAWGSDFETQSIRVAQRPDSYAISYWQLNPTATMLRSALPLSEPNRSLFSLDLQLNGPYVPKVTALTDQLTAGLSSTYDKALAIQQYLRADGGFTYSLTLAPPVKNRLGISAGYDALTNFLITKQGYCVQFATAMVMMSRAAGIPARMAIGFLPGTESKGVWTVLAADAHAWPELYLDGIGWTRFEPTPSRGAPPAYAVPGTSVGATVGSGSSATATAPALGGTTRKTLGTPSTDGGASPKVGLSPSAWGWLRHGWGTILLTALIGMLVSLVVPSAARWRRRISLANARTVAERTEVEWELLTSSLGDLGIAPVPSRTPRQLRVYYNREALLPSAASQALSRVVQGVENSRYAGSPQPPQEGLSADARQVVKAAAATRAGRDRLRAALWPSSGITQLRSARAHLAWLIRAPLRALSDVMRPRRRTITKPQTSIPLKDS
jgi:transglutaminase-like putative cysteine protease